VNVLRVASLLVAAAVAAASGAASGSGAVVTRSYSATLHMHHGRQSLSFRLHQPTGVILLYRISAPRGADVHASVELPRITVPLRIGTSGGPSGSCTDAAARVTCSVGEEGCPMPEGTWHVRVDKRAGAAGDVILWFRVGNPRARAPA
jgi:hypothetical protein